MARGTRSPIGLQRCQVTVQKRPATDAVDESYTPTDGPWTELDTVWAERVELGGDESFRASQLSAAYDTRWFIRYRPDMDPETIDVAKMRRLLYKARTHDIVSATIVERYRDIELKTLSKAG